MNFLKKIFKSIVDWFNNEKELKELNKSYDRLQAKIQALAENNILLESTIRELSKAKDYSTKIYTAPCLYESPKNEDSIEGQMYFNTNTGSLHIFLGGVWVSTQFIKTLNENRQKYLIDSLDS